MEYLLLFIFLPTIMHIIAGETRRKLNKVSIDLVDEVISSLDDTTQSTSNSSKTK